MESSAPIFKDLLLQKKKIGIASARNVAPKNNFVNARSPVRKAQMKIRVAEFISYFFML